MTIPFEDIFPDTTQEEFDYFDNFILDELVLVGDTNRDQTVNLLDVDNFIDALGGEYDICADVNQDGIVNLQDIQPFIALLTEN